MSKNKKYIIISIAILAILFFVFNKKDTKQEALVNEIPEEIYEIQGTEHIAIGAPHEEYNSNPPTSGPHYAEAANWGFYENELPDEQLVHNLEHGGIWISYKDIDLETLDSLKKLAKFYPGSLIITPRSKNEQPIILASWGKLKRLNEYNRSTIIEFIKNNKNKSPEPIAI